MLLFVSLAVAGTAVDMLYEEESAAAASSPPREDRVDKSEQTKLVEGRPASYSALERQEAPTRTSGQP